MPPVSTPATVKSPGTSAAGELERLWRFMSRLRFVAGREELIEAGFSASRIKNWLRGRRLIKLFHGVYVFGRDVETREAVWRAALVVAGPGSALTARSALEHWGAVRLRRKIPLGVQVATRSDRRGRHRGLSPALRNTGVRLFQRKLGPGDVSEKDGLAIVRPSLALIDFAVGATAVDVKFAFLELCRLRLFDQGDVSFCFRRVSRKRGASKITPLLVLWVPELKQIRSVLEGLFLLAWLERKLKIPKVNKKVHGCEVDFYFEDEKLALELDGDAFHSDPVAKKRDIEKQRFLESKGIRVIRVTWKEFMEDPEGVIDRIVHELGLV